MEKRSVLKITTDLQLIIPQHKSIVDSAKVMIAQELLTVVVLVRTSTLVSI